MQPLRNRGILRGRFFLGAALLLAAVITWATGLMMSPHGSTVAKGTEYLRTVIVTFKRNSAIGTLLLCALSAWLLFPRRRPKWPARDWALGVLLAFLGASSMYTLGWAWTAVPHGQKMDENSLEAFANANSVANVTAPPTSPANSLVAPPPSAEAQAQRQPQPEPQPRDVIAPAKAAGQPAAGATEQSADSSIPEIQAAPYNGPVPDSGDETGNNASDENLTGIGAERDRDSSPVTNSLTKF